MLYKIIQKTGLRHMLENKDCEDVIYHKETPEFSCLGIADGKGDRKYGREGGKSSLEVVGAYVEEKGMEYICQEAEKVKCEIDYRIKEMLQNLSNEFHTAIEQFASTILFFVINREKTSYIAIHLGDGAMIGIRKNRSPEIISPPENGITAYHTWLTTDAVSEEHISVFSGKAQGYQNIILVSDGATNVYVGKKLTMKFRKMLTSSMLTLQDFLSYFKDSKEEDDASYIIVEL